MSSLHQVATNLINTVHTANGKAGGRGEVGGGVGVLMLLLESRDYSGSGRVSLIDVVCLFTDVSWSWVFS